MAVLFLGVIWQVRELQDRSRAADLRAAAVEQYNADVRTYDTEVFQYKACQAAIANREASRADNARDNALMTRMVDIFDFYLGESADPAIADLRDAVAEGAALDDSERPPIDPSTCPPTPIPPEFPDLGH